MIRITINYQTFAFSPEAIDALNVVLARADVQSTSKQRDNTWTVDARKPVLVVNSVTEWEGRVE